MSHHDINDAINENFTRALHEVERRRLQRLGDFVQSLDDPRPAPKHVHPCGFCGIVECDSDCRPKRTAQTTTQRTAKHRLAVKERMARYEAALREIIATSDNYPDPVEDDEWGYGYESGLATASITARRALGLLG